MPSVAIIGAGLAGLNAAYQLKRTGVRATLYEARRRVGGRIWSATDRLGAALVVDLGAEFINSDHLDMLALADEFGIELFNREQDAANQAYPPGAFYFEDQGRAEQQVAKNLRALAGQIAADSEALDADFDRVARRLDRLSVKDYLDRHADLISKPYIRTLVEATIRTEYGVEPEDSSALQLIFNLPTVAGQAVEVLGNSDEVYVVKGGSGRIIEQLARRLEGQIRTGMPLTRLAWREDEQRFRLKFANGHNTQADYVILTLPFPVLRDLELDVKLPGRLQRFIQEVGLGRNEKLIAGFDNRAWRQQGGFVMEAWTDLGFAEVWDETQRQPDQTAAALTFFLGAKEVEALEVGSARFVGRAFVQDLDAFLPDLASAASGEYLRTRWGRSRYTRGGYTSFRPGQLTRYGGLQWVDSDDPDERQEVHVGKLVFAGEHLSSEYYGFMNGAAETGRLAAHFVATRIAAELANAASSPSRAAWDLPQVEPPPAL